MVPNLSEDTIAIRFVIGGHQTDIEAIQNAVDRVICRALRNRVQRRLGRLRCVVHEEPPRVIAAGPAAEQLTLSAEGCCAELVENAQHALRD